MRRGLPASRSQRRAAGIRNKVNDSVSPEVTARGPLAWPGLLPDEGDFAQALAFEGLVALGDVLAAMA